MKVEEIINIIERYSAPINHDIPASTYISPYVFKGYLLVAVDVQDTESNSGIHVLSVPPVAPIFSDKYYDYYVVRPIAYLSHVDLPDKHFILYKRFQKIPENIDNLIRKILDIYSEAPWLFKYRVPSAIVREFKKAGYRTFEWHVHSNSQYSYYKGSKTMYSGNPDTVLVVQTPRNDREATEWFSEWLRGAQRKLVIGELGAE